MINKLTIGKTYLYESVMDDDKDYYSGNTIVIKYDLGHAYDAYFQVNFMPIPFLKGSLFHQGIKELLKQTDLLKI